MVLKNIGTFSITMFGVEMTIFTVIYSFIVSKKNYLKEINRNINVTGQTPFFTSEKKFAYTYICTLRGMNKHVITLAFLSLLFFVSSLFLNEKSDSYVTFDWIMFVLSFMYFVYTLVMVIVYVVSYFNEVKD